MVRTSGAVSETELVETNLPLVRYAVSEALQRLPRHVCRDELTAAGMEGLARAARSWDDTRGIPFERYASRRIRGAILDQLRSMDWASRSVRSKGRTLQSATEDLSVLLGRTPTTAEVAEHLGIDRGEIDNLSEDIHRSVVLNLEVLVETSGETGLPQTGATPETHLLETEQKSCLVNAIAALPERLRTVVVGYFIEERPMQAIADELGVTESRVSQMRAEALVLLRDGMNAQLDPDALVPETSTRIARRKAVYFEAVAAQRQRREPRRPAGVA